MLIRIPKPLWKRQWGESCILRVVIQTVDFVCEERLGWYSRLATVEGRTGKFISEGKLLKLLELQVLRKTALFLDPEKRSGTEDLGNSH